jgi:hypothetical protein
LPRELPAALLSRELLRLIPDLARMVATACLRRMSLIIPSCEASSLRKLARREQVATRSFGYPPVARTDLIDSGLGPGGSGNFSASDETSGPELRGEFGAESGVVFMSRPNSALLPSVRLWFSGKIGHCQLLAELPSPGFDSRRTHIFWFSTLLPGSDGRASIFDR